MPTYWFINTDEVNARFLPQFDDIYHNKIWVREYDYVHRMCDQLDKIIELDSGVNLNVKLQEKIKRMDINYILMNVRLYVKIIDVMVVWVNQNKTYKL